MDVVAVGVTFILEKLTKACLAIKMDIILVFYSRVKACK